VRIWIIKHKPNKDPKFHKELILDGEGSSTKELFIILNNGWIFKIDIIINWGQFGLQDANSPIIEELIFLHDFINLILIFIISFVRYIIISILLNNYIFKRDKQESSSGSGTGSSSGTGTGTGSSSSGTGTGSSSGTGTGTGSSSGTGTGSSSSSSSSDSDSSSGSIDTLPYIIDPISDVYYRTLCDGITYKFTRRNSKKNSKKSQENTKKE